MDKTVCISKLANLKTVGSQFSIEGGYITTIPLNYKETMPDCVSLLSQWRIENPSLSPTRFPVSDERTEKWLNNCILHNDSRIMFMVQNCNHKNIGHIGLSEIDWDNSSIRIDSVMKGIHNDSPGIMHHVIEFLKDWCKKELEAKQIDLVVLDDNEKAINLYLSTGFIKNRIIPLRKITNGNEINWVEDTSIENPEKRFLHMICQL